MFGRSPPPFAARVTAEERGLDDHHVRPSRRTEPSPYIGGKTTSWLKVKVPGMG
jgi:hypothetical protein